MGHLSFHAGVEGKLKRTQIRGSIGHTFRQSEGRYKNHGNKDIDKARTKYNLDWSKTGEPLDKLVEDRLERDFKGKRALRKDAVVIREIIAQASPDIYEGLTIEEKQEKAKQFSIDSIGWFREEFGEENVLGFSVHLDETNPHTHFAIMPMTDDGRISQNDFFKGPKDLKRQHRQYREYMIERGWEFEIENKYENVDGVPLPKYKANAKEIEAKRLEQKDLVKHLAQNDETIRDEAVEMAYNDVYGDVLRSEREKLEELEEALKKRSAAQKEANRRIREKDRAATAKMKEADERMQEAALIKKEGTMQVKEAARIMKAVHIKEKAIIEREKGLTRQSHQLAVKEEKLNKMAQNIEKHNHVATAATLAILKDDPKRTKLYNLVVKHGVSPFNPDHLKTEIIDSMKDINKGVVPRKARGEVFVEQQIARMEGPEL
ncbi:hypothetical protein D4905_15620 [Listeria monocytogenes]|nr:hypothetical protein [Listeria monocytogenes]